MNLQKAVGYLKDREGALVRGDDEPDVMDARDVWIAAKRLRDAALAQGNAGKAYRCGQIAAQAVAAMSQLYQKAAAVIEGANPVSGSRRFLGGSSPSGEAAAHERLGAFKAAMSRAVPTSQNTDPSVEEKYGAGDSAVPREDASLPNVENEDDVGDDEHMGGVKPTGKAKAKKKQTPRGEKHAGFDLELRKAMTTPGVLR